MTITAVVPTRNEPSIARLVEDLYGRVDRVLVIDDSDDDLVTWSRAMIAGAEVYAGEGSLAASIRLGWGMALDATVTRIVTIDAGGSHLVEDLPRLLASTADLVIGSRFVDGGSHDGRRRWVSKAYGAACRLKGVPISDQTSGYRVYTPKAIQVLRNQKYLCSRHAFQAEVLAHAYRLKLKIEEVPITYRSGESSLDAKAMREAIAHLTRPLL